MESSVNLDLEEPVIDNEQFSESLKRFQNRLASILRQANKV